MRLMWYALCLLSLVGAIMVAGHFVLHSGQAKMGLLAGELLAQSLPLLVLSMVFFFLGKRASRQERNRKRLKTIGKAEQGDAAAQYELGIMYAEGRDVLKDDAAAAQWLKKAVSQDMVDRQNCRLFSPADFASFAISSSTSRTSSEGCSPRASLI